MSLDRTLLDEAKARVTIGEIVEAAGFRVFPGGRANCPLCDHGKKDQAFSINTIKNLWRCHRCGEAGDAVSLIEALEKCGPADAIKRLLNWAGLDAEKSRAPSPELKKVQEARKAARAQQEAKEIARRMNLASKRWFAGHRLPGKGLELMQTLPFRYLNQRGLPARELAADPQLLAHLNLGPVLRQTNISMLAALQIAPGAPGFRAVHETQINPRTYEKEGDPAKRVYGRAKGSCIYLADRPSSQGVFALAEGIESALAVSIGSWTGGEFWPCAAAYSLHNMAHISLPQGVKTLMLIMDNDGKDRAARRAVRDIVEASGRTLQGRYPNVEVRIAVPPVGFDAADLMEKRGVKLCEQN